MARRTRLRTRVLLLTAAFAIALFAITFGLSWRAQIAQERWSRLVGVETRAIETLEELIRAQNSYRRSAAGPPAARWQNANPAAEPAAVQPASRRRYACGTTPGASFAIASGDERHRSMLQLWTGQSVACCQ